MCVAMCVSVCVGVLRISVCTYVCVSVSTMVVKLPVKIESLSTRLESVPEDDTSGQKPVQGDGGCCGRRWDFDRNRGYWWLGELQWNRFSRVNSLCIFREKRILFFDSSIYTEIGNFYQKPRIVVL